VLSPAQVQFLKSAKQSAIEAYHIYPGAAAAEAALESAWGTSELAKSNNLFGLKNPIGWKGPVVSIPTREFISGHWVDDVPAVWPVFPDWAACMRERMYILKTRPAYFPTIDSKTAEDYITLVSKVWATDPERGHVVTQIYHSRLDLLG
jgi:flagellum-specific peptidoglycan hydrolase FlgJ